jgi:hypothetical protein
MDYKFAFSDPATQAKPQKFISMLVQILQTMPKLHSVAGGAFPVFHIDLFTLQFLLQKTSKKTEPPQQATTLVTHATNERERRHLHILAGGAVQSRSFKGSQWCEYSNGYRKHYCSRLKNPILSQCCPCQKMLHVGELINVGVIFYRRRA